LINYNIAKSLSFKICVLLKIEFSCQYTAFLESEEFYKCQIRIPRTFLPQKGSFLGKNRIFATFRFNTQAFPESGKCFFASKMSNSDSPQKFNVSASYCVVAPDFLWRISLKFIPLHNPVANLKFVNNKVLKALANLW
jgi:hypothetical protein